MSVKVGITEKRLKNKRFRKTEEAILRVFFMGDRYISVGEMALKAGVARSTVYVHHRAFWEIAPDYEKYILRQYRRVVRKMLRNKKLRIKMIYFKMLYFVLINKRSFEVVMKDSGGKIFEKMLDEIQPKLIVTMRLPRNSRTLFAVYKSEVAKIMYEWGSGGFVQNEIDRVLAEIMYLTETARTRLKMLLR